MAKKQAFLEPPLAENNKMHLRIIITDANFQNEYLSVPVDTLRNEHQDKSCVLNINDHPFIKHTSFINYRYAKVINFSQLYNGLQKGIFIKKEDVTEELLKRIQNGAKKSRFLKTEFKQWFNYF